MRKFYTTGVTVLAVLAGTLTACTGDTTDLSGAYCADLRDGASVASLAGSASQVIDDMTPERYAARVFVWVEGSCPEQLDSNEGLRGFLEANGIDPDG
jgi:hypothetical protein